jgi:outer membrane protein assembly factor BamB
MKKNKPLSIISIIVIVTSIFLVGILNLSVNAQSLSQYEWTTPNGDPQYGFRAGGGPAPSSQDVIWTSDLGEPVCAFSDKVFVTGGRSGPIHALDAFTGEYLYTAPGAGGPFKIDENTFYINTGAAFGGTAPQQRPLMVYETSSGNLLYSYDNAPMDAYDPEIGMFYETAGSSGGGSGSSFVCGWSWPDISQTPTKVWEKTFEKSLTGLGGLFASEGRVYVGTKEWTAMCLDGLTGDIIWETPIEGYLGYTPSVYDGKWIQSAGDVIYCFDMETGEILWEFHPGTFFAFFAYMGAIYDGVLYNVCSDYYTYAIDIETGELLWKFKSEEGVGYQGPTIAGGGYVYAYTGREGYTDPNTGKPFKDEYVCLDAKTGEMVWKTDLIGAGGGEFAGPPFINDILAYGNLYTQTYFSSCVCYGPPQPWSGFKANPENTGVGNRNGPSEINLKWVFDTDSAIISSPAAADDKIFVGSSNGTLYALNHILGEPVWTFRTSDGILSSPAYEEGKVYFVSDDGYLYCLNSDTGAELWKTDVGSDTEFLYHGLIRKTSSPTIVNNRIYIGSKDFNLYCINQNNGAIIWTKPLGGLISCTPAVSGSDLYVAVGGTSEKWFADTGGDNGTLYKLNALTGDIIWQAALPYVRLYGFGQKIPRELHGSPVIGDGMVFQSGNGWTTFAIDSETGEQLWNFTTEGRLSGSEGGALMNAITPVYSNGKIYVQDFFRLACLNATDGEKIWDLWLGHSMHGDPVIADDKIYVASDLKVMWSVDVDTGEKFGFWQWDDLCASAACIYDNKLYWGTLGKKVFCFEQLPYGEVTNYATTPTAATSEIIPNFTHSTIEPEEPATLEQLATETPLITTEVAILIAVVVAVVIGVSAFWALRKRK